nr:hypothetical protein [Sicyoidochytrium minutum DNA virus]
MISPPGFEFESILPCEHGNLNQNKY